MIKIIDGKYYDYDAHTGVKNELSTEEAFYKVVDYIIEASIEGDTHDVKYNDYAQHIWNAKEKLQDQRDLAFDLYKKITIPDDKRADIIKRLKKGITKCYGYYTHYIASLYFFIQMCRIRVNHDPDAAFDLFMWCKEDLFNWYLIDLNEYMYICDAFFRISGDFYKLHNCKDYGLEPAHYFDYDHSIYRNHLMTAYLEEGMNIFFHDFRVMHGDYFDPYDLKKNDFTYYDNNNRCSDHLYITRFMAETALKYIPKDKLGTDVYEIVDKLLYYGLCKYPRNDGTDRTTKPQRVIDDEYFIKYDEDRIYKTYEKTTSDEYANICDCACFPLNWSEDTKSDIVPYSLRNDKALKYKGQDITLCDALAFYIHENGIRNEDDYLHIKRRKEILKRRKIHRFRLLDREKYILKRRRKRIFKALKAIAIACAIILLWPKRYAILSYAIAIIVLLGFGGPSYYGALIETRDELRELNRKIK